MKKRTLKFEITKAQALRAHDAPYDNNIVETLHRRKVSDPFRPLEAIDAPATTEWIARQNKIFNDFVQPAAAIVQDTIDFLERGQDRGMRESMPSLCGSKYLVWRMHPGQERYSLYLKDIPDYNAPARLLLDPAVIDPQGKTNIVSIENTPDGKTLAYALSVSGSDETTMRFMDIASGDDMGLSYSRFRSDITWDRDGGGFHYCRPVSDTSKSTEVCYHKMGDAPECDVAVFTPQAEETETEYMHAQCAFGHPAIYQWISVTTPDKGKNALLCRKTGSTDAFREVFPHKDGKLLPLYEYEGEIIARTTLNAPNGRIIAFDPANPAPQNWREVIPENAQDPLNSAFVRNGKIFARYRHDTGDVLKLYDISGKHLHDAPIPPLSKCTIDGWYKGQNKCLITFDSFQESGNIYQYDYDTNTVTLFHQSGVPVNLKDCVVERLHARSKDGSLIPMTVIRDPRTKLDGTAATRLYGYGGFNVSLAPYFSLNIAKWVRSGGIYVQANLRGGGEYGQDWYNAGRRENKQNVFDDFAACAEHLITARYTSPRRLAIQGGSNGGLLTLVTMQQRPELFGAVISEVPVADMFRFHIGSYYGFGWKSDYGDPGIRRDFNIAAQYSPLHNVQPRMKHPPLLIATDINDDRVQPWHSFKMAAMMQSFEAQGAMTLLKVNQGGGHGSGSTEKQWHRDAGDINAFLSRTLGPINQNDYVAAKKRRQPGRRPA